MYWCSALPIQLLWKSWTIEVRQGFSISTERVPTSPRSPACSCCLTTFVLQTNGEYAGAVIFCIFMGWLRHALGRLRVDLVKANSPAITCAAADGADSSLIGGNGISRQKLTWLQSLLSFSLLRRSTAALRLVDAAAFAAAAIVGFMNMLVVMAFNPGLMFAIVGGETLGVLTVEPLGGFVRGESLSAADAAGRGCH